MNATLIPSSSNWETTGRSSSSSPSSAADLFRRQDPLAFEAGDENLYRYAANSPMNATDPTGLKEKPTRVYFKNSNIKVILDEFGGDKERREAWKEKLRFNFGVDANAKQVQEAKSLVKVSKIDLFKNGKDVSIIGSFLFAYQLRVYNTKDDIIQVVEETIKYYDVDGKPEKPGAYTKIEGFKTTKSKDEKTPNLYNAYLVDSHYRAAIGIDLKKRSKVDVTVKLTIGAGIYDKKPLTGVFGVTQWQVFSTKANDVEKIKWSGPKYTYYYHFVINKDGTWELAAPGILRSGKLEKEDKEKEDKE
jgi:hypothetical protein